MQEICTLCGAESDDLYVSDDRLLCPDCLSDHTLICSTCGERIWLDDNAGSSDTPLCQSCYDDHYTNCSHCHQLLPHDSACYSEDDDSDDLPLCSDCYFSRENDAIIHDYSYKPTPRFFGEAPRYFGVELEIDGAGELRHNASALLELANEQEEFLYIKHDGSLNDGLELVTHPISLYGHLYQVPWESIMKKAISLGYLSHRTSTCGLHVHISRLAFGDNEASQDACIARVLYFFEKHWEELLKFSRRNQRQLERWAARYGYKDQPMEILDHAKKGSYGRRYTCVNLQNDDTVEFRIFRGTLKYNTLVATLQMLDRICDVAISLSDDDLKGMAWTSFVSGIDRVKAPELVQYLKERRLYVNDQVETEDDI